VKNRLGRIPTMHDFIKQNSLDPEVIIGYSNNYYDFLLKMKEEIPALTDYELAVITMLSKEILNGKRIHEVLLVEALLKNDSISKIDFIASLKEFGTYYDDETIKSVENMFSLNFHITNDRKKYGLKPVIELIDEQYQFNDELKTSLNDIFYKAYFTDIVSCANIKNQQYDPKRPLTLYKKYSRRDACRLLNWAKEDSSTIYGYRVKHGTCPIFVTYHKKDEVDSSVNYGDEFLSADVFRWFSRSKLTLESNEVKAILAAEQTGLDIHLFTKKDDGEGFDFYYMGTTSIAENSPREEEMFDKNGKKIPVVTMNMVLEQPVQYDIYHYLVEE